jgi:hypothetical protein
MSATDRSSSSLVKNLIDETTSTTTMTTTNENGNASTRTNECELLLSKNDSSGSNTLGNQSQDNTNSNDSSLNETSSHIQQMESVAVASSTLPTTATSLGKNDPAALKTNAQVHVDIENCEKDDTNPIELVRKLEIVKEIR